MASWIIGRPSMSRRPETHPGDDAVLQALWIAQGDDGLPVLELVESPSASGGSPLASMRDDGQVELRSEAWMAVTS